MSLSRPNSSGTSSWPTGVVAGLLLLLCAAACRPESIRDAAARVEEGSFYTVPDGDGGHSIIKVLALDQTGVHIRTYKNRFRERPERVDPAALSLGTVDDVDGFGIGHLPLTRAAFDAMQPKLLQRGTVSNEELEGFREWQSAAGGYYEDPSEW